MTKAQYTDWLNEVGVAEDDKESNGGRIPDHAKLGNWSRIHDPIAFNVGYQEAVREEEFRKEQRRP